jgi:predicted TIM-barrel fold metal-dependent hydrolase
MIDMHLNPVRTPDERVLTTLGAPAVAAACAHYMRALDTTSGDRGVMVILSDAALDDLEDPARPGTSRLAPFAPALVPALAVDFRRDDAPARLERARALGVAALKFHPYLQRIVAADFTAAAALARDADRLGMFVMVCGSYGTRALNRHDGVRLAAALVDEVGCPIVLSHGGGRQVLDAMLIAEDAPQLLLDTSFSLPYYFDSSIETDFAFAMRKLGPARWVFGSDAPFMTIEDSVAAMRRFFDRHRFAARDVDQILHGTAAALLQDR